MGREILSHLEALVLRHFSLALGAGSAIPSPERNVGAPMAYSGPERRIHRVLITENTEYHMRRRVCLCVRDRRSGHWQDEHKVLFRELVGSASECAPDLDINLTEIPRPGERIMFDGPRGPVYTSPVVKVERSPKDLVHGFYPPDPLVALASTSDSSPPLLV